MPFPRLIRRLLCPRNPTATENPGAFDAEVISNRGWRQWSCVRPADIPAVLDETASRGAGKVADGTRLLVVTQSCDLLHETLEDEPFVDLYGCEPLDPEQAPRGDLTAAQNPRSLMIELSVDGEAKWFRIDAKGRALVPRHRLCAISPDPSVQVEDRAVTILQRWLINRFVRTALPDAFNARAQKVYGKSRDALKKRGVSFIGLYIRVTPNTELPEGQSYTVDFVGLVEESLGLDQRAEIDRLLGKIAKNYRETDGIEECDYQVMGHEEASYSLLRTHRRFSLDYLSLRKKPGGELPPST
jgi:hypothetical protein